MHRTSTDPQRTVVKAHIRKASVLHSMREYSKALEALQAATTADTADAHTAEIQAQEMKTQQALFSQRAGETEEQTLERAMKDPEVAVCFLLGISMLTAKLTEFYAAGDHD